MKHTLLTAILAVAALAGCSDAGREPAIAGEQPQPAPTASGRVVIPVSVQKESGIATAPVRPQELAETIRSTARITTDENETWRVGSIADGRIAEVRARPGDLVHKGQVLARIHSHDIHESRAQHNRAKAELARTRGVEEFSLRQRDRARRLYDLKAGSLVQLEQKETELRNAQTDVRNAGVELERTRTHLEDVLRIPAESSLVPPAPDGSAHDLIPVLSPANGVVMSRNITPGTVVTTASDLFLISNLTSLWAIAEVNEEYLGRLQVGRPVHLSVQAYPNEVFQGRIGRLGESLNPQTRTIEVRVNLANNRSRLKPEMYAAVEIELSSAGRALTVPAESVQDVRGQSVVFLRTADDTFEVRPVRTGKTMDGSVEVTSGLRDGDVIAVRSAFVLKSEFLKASLAN